MITVLGWQWPGVNRLVEPESTPVDIGFEAAAEAFFLDAGQVHRIIVVQAFGHVFGFGHGMARGPQPGDDFTRHSAVVSVKSG